MKTRRDFLTHSVLASAALATTAFSSFTGAAPNKTASQKNLKKTSPGLLPQTDSRFFPSKLGLGTVATGNGFNENSNRQIYDMLDTAWNSGIRFFDTSPFYGFGLSERRLGHFLSQKPRDEYVIATKIGRVFQADRTFYDNYDSDNPHAIWKRPSPFTYHFDYSAEGVRKSVEDSLQRMGLSHFDIIFVHDLSPDTPDMGAQWVEHFEIAKKGAFPELTKMREEGLIKGWGMGVNTPPPILQCLEAADPDVMLVAIQYSLLDHKNGLNHVLNELHNQQVEAVIGAPFNSGFIAGQNRWNYGPNIPEEMAAKKSRISNILERYNISLISAALQFSAAHPAVTSVIPGASSRSQVLENVEAMSVDIPDDAWAELKAEGFIEENAPV